MNTAISCPHCRRDTPVEQQRCTHCGLNMMSNQEFARLTQRYWPGVAELEQLGKDERGRAARLLGELATEAEAIPLMQDHYAQLRQQWQPVLAHQAQLQQVLRFNWAILVFFALVALIGGLYTGDWALALLLSLPVVGWYWLGIHRLKSPGS